MSLVSEEALGAHCRRVAGWAKQAAHKVDCSTAELQALERAALLHHAENLVLRPKAFAAIAGDLQVEISEGPPCSELYSGMTLEILQAYNSPGPAASRPAELAKILEWADQFDETFELSAIDPLPADELAARPARFKSRMRPRYFSPAKTCRFSPRLRRTQCGSLPARMSAWRNWERSSAAIRPWRRSF